MNCREARAALTAPRSGRIVSSAERHLAGCGACTDYAAALASALGSLRRRHAGTVPPAGFAARVAAALPPGQDPVVWAAVRILPLSLALFLLLGWFAWTADSEPVLKAPTENVISWVLERPGGDS